MSWRKFELSEFIQSQGARKKQIYILPTGFGFLFLGGSIVMILIGSAYQNNSVNLMGFFLLAFCFTAMVATQRNLKRIEVSLLEPVSGFSGEAIPVHCVIKNKSAKLGAHQIRFQLPSEFQSIAHYDARSVIPPKQQRKLIATFRAPSRGIRSIERVRLETEYPYGLFRAWSFRRTDAEAVIYPSRRRVDSDLSLRLSSADKLNTSRQKKFNGDELLELVPLVSGETNRAVDWKLFARRGLLAKKQFEEAKGIALLLKLPARFKSLEDQENTLIELSSCVSAAIERHIPVGIESPFERISPADSAPHAKRILRTLAGWAAPMREPKIRKAWQFWSRS